ncbi:Pro-kumamolisin [Pseudomassariella vexata]|uniref:tripeptidyl-peptidase II n=1 Tax=Pseudomassariella vexata TaxID=1141098 RepID=A0A1Y2E9Y7_9PEZI|nr:Pro-kumamolisin [Pseudomassariella vexata]ORY67675.1 Pro-kumamolisin [Pseudomassariella vexata]
MRINVLINFLAALAVAVETKPPRRAVNHVVHEELHVSQRSWTKGYRLYGTSTLPVRIGLAQQNLHRAEEYINAVSHPKSKDYGKHWSRERIIETFAPKQESVDAVKEWLEAEGIESSRIEMSKGRHWLEFKATVQEVEGLLKTKYHMYKHTQLGHPHIACDKYHVPDHLVNHIDIITPTVHFDQRIGRERENKKVPLSEDKVDELKKRSLAKRQRPENGIQGIPGGSGFSPKQGDMIQNALATLDDCDQMLTLDCIRALYGIPRGSLAQSNNTLGIVEYTPQAFLQSDLNMFFAEFSPDIPSKEPVVQLIDNAVVQTQNQSFDFNGESSLDLEFAMGLINPQRATLYQVGDLNKGASFGNFLDAIDGSFCTFQGGDSVDPNVDSPYPDDVRCGTANATNVISTSYGYNEGDLGSKYIQRQCLEYMKLGLQGVSMIFSSGDDGVSGNGNTCIDPETGAYNDGSSGLFNPGFPGTCPYVTSVGATQIMNGSSVRSPESACELVIISRGGFSNVFQMPSYQQKAVADYFANSAPSYNSSQFNNSMTVRGYPDVAANGANYVTAVDGEFSLFYGTSASAPVFASMINMINEKRIEAGKGPVGFINPVLYENPQIMNDITTGNNPGCGTDGFAAVEGWDPLTGLGTPDYPSLEKLFTGLP